MNKKELSKLNENLKRINSTLEKALDKKPISNSNPQCPIMQGMREWVDKNTK